ncbi:flavin-containing monooxygenase [Saccharopolyspora sp. NPDC000995]
MNQYLKAVIVGTGFGGLGQAIQLEKAGIRNYLVLEKADDVGGTWRDNSYPGCECDVEAHLYSLSYEQKPDWLRDFATRTEIFTYLRNIADKHRLRSKIRFGVGLTGATWEPDQCRWRLGTTTGEELFCQFLISAVGGLHIPRLPELPGLETFKGQVWHSSQWNHDFDFAGKRVAVIGTGASGIQLVPPIAAAAAKLYVFQRTPHWVLPKRNRDVPGWLRALFKHIPGAQRVYRNTIYWRREMRALAFNGRLELWDGPESIAKQHIARHIKDSALREKLTPKYTMGCKRVLFSNDYYPALARDNVELVTDSVADVRADSVVDASGVERDIDAIIYATGFRITDALDYLHIIGTDKRFLAEEWATGGMRAHLGTTVAGFPNMFFLLGPNTAVTHTSVTVMLEAQARYVVNAIRLVDRSGAAALDVRRDVQEEFQTTIQQKLVKGVWARGGCTNFYHDAAGVNRAIWPGFTWQFWLATRRVRRKDYRLLHRAPQDRRLGTIENTSAR